MRKRMNKSLTHKGYRFLRTGVVPLGKRHIVEAIEVVIDEMIEDLGGPEEVTATQKVLINAIKTDLIFLGIVSDWLQKQPSIIDEKGNMLPPLNAFFLATQNTVTRLCRELGLKRINPIQSLEGYLESKAKEAHSEPSEKPPTDDAGERGNVPLRASCEGISGDIQ